MITINKVNEMSNANHVELMGLSTDTKPTGTVTGTTGACPIGNGSVFLEMDTSDVYIYDEQNSVWRKI